MFPIRMWRTACLLPLTALLAEAHGTETPTQRDQIVAAERAELDALKSSDIAAFAGLIADEAVFVDAAGPASKAEIVKHSANFRLRDYTMSNIQLITLSQGVDLLVYRVAETGTSHGGVFSANVLVSSIWVRRDGRWLCLFSQETAAKD